eukprot:COSAG01_NODE_4718_length_4794_cov_363.209585_4_plen_76_part_00
MRERTSFARPQSHGLCIQVIDNASVHLFASGTEDLLREMVEEAGAELLFIPQVCACSCSVQLYMIVTLRTNLRLH